MNNKITQHNDSNYNNELDRFIGLAKVSEIWREWYDAQDESVIIATHLANDHHLDPEQVRLNMLALSEII
jgi:hypothetical protein